MARIFGGSSGRAGPTEQRADAGLEFFGAEGLVDVVIRAGVQAVEAVDFVGPGGEHQDVGIREFAEAAANLHAVDVGEVDVQGHQFGVGPADGLDAGKTVGCLGHHEVELLEDEYEEAADVGVIFDDDSMARGRG
ncbi:hypothetical protein PJL18_04214 [Paenarthrobacter nicotinovorans]|nr:hypothetical protein [Paenarthrobacter nicotinovorans]